MVRIVREPEIYLVGKQEVQFDELDRFLSDFGVEWESDALSAGEYLVETGGRLCYLSFAKPRPGGNAAYTQHLLDVKHESVLEHAVYSLIVTGVSRSLSHELVRHRHISPSQLSQRYVDEKDARFVEPPCIAENDSLHAEWASAVEHCQEAYVSLATSLEAVTFAGVPDKTLRRKLAREAARSVLPNATETMLFLTLNARAARHIFTLRGSEHADAEIRRLTLQLYLALATESPNLFAGFETYTCPDGSKGLRLGTPKSGV